MLRVCWSHWNLMTWADAERIYTTKATIGFKRIPKESTWATNIKCYLTIIIFFGHFPRATGWMSFLLKRASAKPRGFSFSFYIYFFNNHKHAWVPFPNPNFKSKISHSLIHMGFIGLVMLSGVRGLWKKGLERLKECLRVTLSKNLKSVACTFWVGLYSFYLIH